MPQVLNMRIRGVYTHPSQWSAAPPGALRVAENVVLDAEDQAESRRGFRQYGEPLLAQPGRVLRLISYASAIYAQVEQLLYRRALEEGSPWEFQENVEPPSGISRVRDVEAGGSLFLTTQEGLLKLDQDAGPWRRAGTPRPLHSSFTLTGTGGFLTAERSVAYRVVLLYTDANRREIVSAPSQRLVVFNDDISVAKNVVLTWYLPAELGTEHSYRVYRSRVTELELDVPDDELQLVREGKLTTTDLSNGFVTFTDSTPEVLRGAALYTNASQQGILQANDRPPLARDVCLFRDSIFLANLEYPQRYTSSLIGVGPGALIALATTGDTTDASAVVTSIPDTSSLHVGMRPSGSGIPASARILSIDSSSQVTLTEDATATAAGVAIEFQDVLTIAGRDYFAATAEDAGAQEFLALDSEGPSENIDTTARSIVAVVNQDAAQDEVYSYYLSGVDEVPGAFLLEARDLGQASFALTSTVGLAFSPQLPSSGVEASSDNGALEGGIAFSKAGELEAFPFANVIRSGSQSSSGTGARAVLRILPLRDAVIVLTDREVRIISGDQSPFSERVLDTTTRLRGIHTAAVFNDRVFMYSDQGVVAVSQSGTEIVSRPIEDELQRVSSDLFPDFEELAHGYGYESDREYHLWVPQEVGDTVPKRCWRYNVIRNVWYWMSREHTAGLVHPLDRRLYLGNDVAKVHQERKDFAPSDFADEQYGLEVRNVLGTDLTIDDPSGLAVGHLLQQETRESNITELRSVDVALEVSSVFGSIVSVNDTNGLRLGDTFQQAAKTGLIIGISPPTTLILDQSGWTLGAANVHRDSVVLEDDLAWESVPAIAFTPIPWALQWIPQAAGNSGILKHFSELTFLWRNADFAQLTASFGSNFSHALEDVVLSAKDLGGGWGESPWGEAPFGVPFYGEQPIRSHIPLASQRCSWLNVRLDGSQVFSGFQLVGVSARFEPMSTKFKGAG